MRLAAVLLALVAASAGDGQAGVPVLHDPVAQRARYLMGTICQIAVPAAHEAEIETAFAEAQRIEAMLSTWIEESELSRLNRGELREASPELRALLARAQEWSTRTSGAFDPRIKSLVGVWKTREEGAVPARDAIAHAMQTKQWEEGAFGKGYALDRMLAGMESDEVMIDFGGQIAIRGKLRVTIADPADRERPVIALTMRDGSISTSSGSEKTFAVDGRRFSHILDPRTGNALPPRGSVSAIADSALAADILSTALYVMGEEEGLRWADANGVAAIFIDTTQSVRLSKEARKRARDLELLDRNYTVKE